MKKADPKHNKSHQTGRLRILFQGFHLRQSLVFHFNASCIVKLHLNLLDSLHIKLYICVFMTGANIFYELFHPRAIYLFSLFWPLLLIRIPTPPSFFSPPERCLGAVIRQGRSWGLLEKKLRLMIGGSFSYCVGVDGGVNQCRWPRPSGRFPFVIMKRRGAQWLNYHSYARTKHISAPNGHPDRGPRAGINSTPRQRCNMYL